MRLLIQDTGYRGERGKGKERLILRDTRSKGERGKGRTSDITRYEIQGYAPCCIIACRPSYTCKDLTFATMITRGSRYCRGRSEAPRTVNSNSDSDSDSTR